MPSSPDTRSVRITVTPSLRGPGSNGKKEVLHISQSSRTGASPSDGLVSYPGHSFREGSYSSAEMQSVYSTTPADWAVQRICSPATTILPTTARTYHSLNCFGHVIYVPQTSSDKNIVKLLTRPNKL